MNHNKIKQFNDWLFVLLLVSYIFLFEWTIFSFDEIKPLVNFLKISIPAILFMLSIFTNVASLQSKFFQNYLFFLFLLFCWSLIPSFLSDHSSECIYQWMKFVPRCLMICSVGIYLTARSNVSISLIKVLAMIAVLVVIQFLLFAAVSYLNPALRPQVHSGNGMPLYGQWGVLGGYVSIPERINFRLLSYWLEPSKASGFLFPIFFLTQAVYFYTRLYKWKFISYICLLGGILCFSNAGYLGFAGAALYGLLRLPKLKFMQFFKFILIIFLILFAILARFYVTKYGIDSEILRMITGAYSNHTNATYDNVIDGRVQLLTESLKTFLRYPMGVGLRIPGADKVGNGFAVSASAPIYWLIFTGLPGFFLLIFAQLQVLSANLKYSISLSQLRIMQAWIAATIQQCIYGDWMSPLYLLLAVLVFISMNQEYRFNSEVSRIFNRVGYHA